MDYKGEVENGSKSAKYYVGNRRRDLEFEEDYWVYLMISPMKGVMMFGKKGKLSPRYVLLMKL